MNVPGTKGDALSEHSMSEERPFSCHISSPMLLICLADFRSSSPLGNAVDHSWWLFLTVERSEVVNRLHHLARLGSPHATAVALGLYLVDANKSPSCVARFHHPSHDRGMLWAAGEVQQRVPISKEGDCA